MTIERLTKYFVLIHQHLLHFRFELANYQEKIVETVIGVAKCMIEIESPEKGVKYLNEISKNIINVKKIETFKKEILESIQ
ncbi:MAG: hypothetical protein HC852_21580 [Acaryochloridaceae cyanobacterium RU_4_10]|nr:hypothetical protein [Acaryochloridaceae cyanobacterium RU_4_10]